MATITNFFHSITNRKDEDYSDAEFEKDYKPYLVNKSLSYFRDTVLVANELNTRPFVENKDHFRFLSLLIPKKQRKMVWERPSKDTNLAAISDYYNVSVEKAEDYMRILTDEQVQDIIDELDTGGRG